MSEHRPELFVEARAQAASRLAVARNIVAQIERRENIAKPQAPVLPTGFPEIDAGLPRGGLCQGGMHEILGLAARRFALHLLGQSLQRAASVAASVAFGHPALWVMSAGAGHCIYGPGLEALGVAPDRLVLAQCRTRQDLLWTLEEALKSGAFASICGECDTPLSATEARRLQLAAEAGGSLGLLVCEGQMPLSAPGAVSSRWYADALPAKRGQGALHRRAGVRLDRHRGHTGGPVQWWVDLP